MAKRQWKDFSAGQRVAIMVLASVQVSLAVSAWVDLAKRPAIEVNGSKGRWAGLIAINFIGPIAYFTKGRRR